MSNTDCPVDSLFAEPADTSAVSLPALGDDNIETAEHDRSVGRPPPEDDFLEQPVADMVVDVNTLNSEPAVACNEPDEEIDVDVSSRETCLSPEVVSLRNNDRKFRMMRRKRLNLRRKMLSFDPPEKVTIFRRLRFIHDSSDSSDDFTSDGESIPVKPEESKTSRKRVRNVDGWKRNKIKRARESGSAYVSHKGVFVSAKRPCVKSCLCREKCRYRCSEKVNDASRQEIFSRFYGMICCVSEQ